MTSNSTPVTTTQSLALLLWCIFYTMSQKVDVFAITVKLHSTA